MLDELDDIDRAFAGNRLLATFSPGARALLEPRAETIELRPGTIVLERGQDVLSTVFPYGPAMISMIVELSGGRTVEVASVGREGAVGGIVSCGNVPAFTSAEVLVAGRALRLPMAALEDAKSQSPFVANLFCRYSDYLLAQVMQSVACNAHHPIEERTARWMLHAQDRSGNRLELTQQALAGLLGVQRTTINAVVQQLEQAGVVESRRGSIIIADRVALKRRACECYDVLERHFAGVIGASGSGGSIGCD